MKMEKNVKTFLRAILFWALFSDDEPFQDEFSAENSFAFVAGAMTIARGWSHTPARTRNRIVFLSVMAAGTLVYYHWEAMIISYLAARNIVLPFRSLEELLGKSNYKVGRPIGQYFSCLF